MDDQKSHAKFVQKFELPFPLLCDLDAAVATSYGSYGLKKFMGKEYMGILRQTFVIDPDGQIAHIYRKVKPETHAMEVLNNMA
jgi:thioredoxin-dependent peroxiredoxin